MRGFGRWVGGGPGGGYVSCFRDFDVCSICMGGDVAR